MSAFEPSRTSFEQLLRVREDNVDLVSFEKDWHLVQVFRTLARFAATQEARFVFTGGTSLSKRGLIARFSEDADFLIVPPQGKLPSRTVRSESRKALVTAIMTELPGYTVKMSRSFDAGFQQLVEIYYPTVCDVSLGGSQLRPHIRLEMRYTEGSPATTMLDVRSLVNETLSQPGEVQFEALEPIVIAANKLVGLAWRVVRREKGDLKEEDRNLVRHVHDLAALEPLILASPDEFKDLVKEVMEKDRPRYSDLSVEPDNLLRHAIRLFTEDGRYEEEYNRFVSRMSFAPIPQRIAFARAFDAYLRIVDVARG